MDRGLFSPKDAGFPPTVGIIADSLLRILEFLHQPENLEVAAFINLS